jgi:AcrR family transcriptional regulator
MNLRSEQKAERRERILGSAREMIGARGYESLTMRDLALTARVTVPTIYNLIGGKEAVLFAAVEEQTAQFLAAIEYDRKPDAGSRALAVVDSCTRELLRMPRYYRSLLAILLRSESAREMRELVDRALVGEFETALEQMRDAGELVGWVDPTTTARSLTEQLEFISMGWAGGQLGSRQFPDAAIYGVGLMLLGVASGASHHELSSRIEHAQHRIRARQRKTKPPVEVANAQA